MVLANIDLQKIKIKIGRFCSEKTPEHLKDQLRFEYEIEKQNVIIYEVRPFWKDPSEFIKMPIAKLTYVNSRNIWKLYWKRANDKWTLYETRRSATDLGSMLKEIDEDSFGCFFG